jgi:hypothetical protein
VLSNDVKVFAEKMSPMMIQDNRPFKREIKSATPYQFIKATSAGFGHDVSHRCDATFVTLAVLHKHLVKPPRWVSGGFPLSVQPHQFNF